MAGISGQALDVWWAVARYVDENGIPPTVREVGLMTGYSPTGVLRWLDKLMGYGVLERDEEKSRSIRLIERPPGMHNACEGCRCTSRCDLEALRRKLAEALAAVDAALTGEEV